VAVTRYTDGPVTVTLSGELETFVRQALEASAAGCVAVMEREAEAIATNARNEWYGPSGVSRETGKGGDIVAMTTVDVGKGEVRVSVGSTDTRTGRIYKLGKKTEPVRTPSGREFGRVSGGMEKGVPLFQHGFWSTTLRAKAVSREDWFAWQKKNLPTLPPPNDPWWQRNGPDGKRNGRGLAHGKWYILRTDAPEGHTAQPWGHGFLMAELVLKPTRAAIKRITPELGEAIASRMRSK